MASKTMALTLTIDDIWPCLLERLRQLAHPEAQSLAQGAADVPGLDELSLLALVDWLEERQSSDIAARVRRLIVEDGTLLLIECDEHLSLSTRNAIRESVGPVIDRLRRGGKSIEALVVPKGLTVRAIVP